MPSHSTPARVCVADSGGQPRSGWVRPLRTYAPPCHPTPLAAAHAALPLTHPANRHALHQRPGRMGRCRCCRTRQSEDGGKQELRRVAAAAATSCQLVPTYFARRRLRPAPLVCGATPRGHGELAPVSRRHARRVRGNGGREAGGRQHHVTSRAAGAKQRRLCDGLSAGGVGRAAPFLAILCLRQHGGGRDGDQCGRQHRGWDMGGRSGGEPSPLCLCVSICAGRAGPGPTTCEARMALLQRAAA